MPKMSISVLDATNFTVAINTIYFVGWSDLQIDSQQLTGFALDLCLLDIAFRRRLKHPTVITSPKKKNR